MRTVCKTAYNRNVLIKFKKLLTGLGQPPNEEYLERGKECFQKLVYREQEATRSRGSLLTYDVTVIRVEQSNSSKRSIVE